MIAYAEETALAVPTVYIGHSVVTALRCGRTVNDDLCYSAHGIYR
jgi:hypothetical protein